MNGRGGWGAGHMMFVTRSSEWKRLVYIIKGDHVCIKTGVTAQ